MRNPAFCICENKDADQLRGIYAADERLCFCYTSSFLVRNFKLQAIFCCCITRFVSDLVGNSEDKFSCDMAYMTFFFVSKFK